MEEVVSNNEQQRVPLLPCVFTPPPVLHVPVLGGAWSQLNNVAGLVCASYLAVEVLASCKNDLPTSWGCHFLTPEEI